MTAGPPSRTWRVYPIIIRGVIDASGSFRYIQDYEYRYEFENAQDCEAALRFIIPQPEDPDWVRDAKISGVALAEGILMTNTVINRLFFG